MIKKRGANLQSTGVINPNGCCDIVTETNCWGDQKWLLTVLSSQVESEELLCEVQCIFGWRSSATQLVWDPILCTMRNWSCSFFLQFFPMQRGDWDSCDVQGSRFETLPPVNCINTVTCINRVTAQISNRSFVIAVAITKDILRAKLWSTVLMKFTWGKGM